jgi:hypothetical protein
MRQFECDAPGRRIAVYEKEIATKLDLLHQPRHMSGVARQQAATVAVNANNVWDRCEIGCKGAGELLAGHVKQ